MKKKIVIISMFIIILFIGLFEFYKHGRSLYMPIYYRIVGEKTLVEVADKLEPDVEKRLKSDFTNAGFESFPKKLTFLAFKEEKRLEVWGERDGKWYFIKVYPILAASGTLGPKLKEGDRQVPEGIYNIINMNPNSYYHLAMLINYPNEFDKQKAKIEGRTNLGGDICIHGKDVSAGCLAMGDTTIEDLFVAVKKVGMNNVKVIIAPYDFRNEPRKVINETKPVWISEVYSSIIYELNKYPIKY